MVVRIAHLSDAHLSASRPFFASNFARIAESIRASHPDLILSTGDLSLSGADSEEELAHAVAAHAAIGSELICVPGNHDVGNEPRTRKNVSNVERVARWHKLTGASAWVRDVPGWRLIGFDNHSLDFDDGQWDVIARGVRDSGSRRIALIHHKPLMIDAIDEEEASYWPIFADMRARLLDVFGNAKPALSISGHVHQWRDRVTHGIRQIWAPSSAFILGDPYQPTFGSKLIGWVEHEFHANGHHDARLRTVDGARLDDLGQMPQVYRQLPRLDTQPDLWTVKQ